MTPAVSVIGLGRFGATLGALFERARISWEPIEATPSIAHYEAHAPIVLLAVPLAALESVVRSLKPSTQQIIVDTCSVKVRAEQVLRNVLGDGRWVATHPLFGPAALRSDDAPRVIVCPRNDRPADTSHVESMYAQLGCTVRLLDAHAHDQLMAKSQALAAYLGRVLREASLPAEGPWTPPSTAPLYALSASPTAERGHLYDSLLRDNPYAAAVRYRLRGALEVLDVEARGGDLQMLRESIDAVDHRIIGLLKRRAQLAVMVSARKAELGQPVQDAAREAAAFADRRRWAEDEGVDPDFVETLFAAVLPWSRALQEKARG